MCPNLRFLTIDYDPLTLYTYSPRPSNAPQRCMLNLPKLRAFIVAADVRQPEVITRLLAAAPNIGTFEITGADRVFPDVIQRAPSVWNQTRRMRLRGEAVDAVFESLVSVNQSGDISQPNPTEQLGLRSLAFGPVLWDSNPRVADLLKGNTAIKRLDFVLSSDSAVLTRTSPRINSCRIATDGVRVIWESLPRLQILTVTYHAIIASNLFNIDASPPTLCPLRTFAVDMSIIRDENVFLFDATDYEETLDAVYRQIFFMQPPLLQHLRCLVLGFSCGASRPTVDTSPSLRGIARGCRARRIQLVMPHCWNWLVDEYETSRGWAQCYCKRWSS